MTKFDPSDRNDVQRLFNQRAASAALAYERRYYRAQADARANARLHVLAQTYADMLRAQPDLWGDGFDAAGAAELTLPVIERLISGR